MNPVIVVSLGDPAGIGPEIVVKALASEKVKKAARCVVVGSRNVVENACAITGIHFKINVIEDSGDYVEGAFNLIDAGDVDMEKLEIGKVSGMCGRAAYEYVAKSIEIAMSGKADAVATAPINKESLKAGGVDYIGHTEIFGALTGIHDPLTMFEVRGMRIFFLTRHMPLRKACDLVTKERIV
ncbi:MAG: 4-hydroxythreonine-4-phosphate dehydrogenase PdxA, partial [Synergistaceae bacterium]|nr:4-hydroxythreonine-4-phosphate dehydrogenase PdxA [Synergistaceae bacterium]